MKIVYFFFAIAGILFVVFGYWNFFYSLLVLFAAILTIRYASKFSGLLPAIAIIFVGGLSIFLWIVFGIMGYIKSDWEEYDRLKEIYQTDCDCIRAFEKGEIDWDIIEVNYGYGILSFHPCAVRLNNIYGEDGRGRGLKVSGYFSDSLTPTNNDTLSTLKRIFDCP
tara:strand:+ start:243 stop:740 length:498 start_codon:yes stop_codon:yes gene_type:complete